MGKKFDTNICSPKIFKELARDPNIHKFSRISIDEARAIVQAEIEGLVENASMLEKPYAKSVDLDFKIDGPSPYTDADIKHPVGTEILKKQSSSSDI